ncbi:MAG: hypothetical protein P8Z74_16390, partial [Acidobacteriota bacterium]
GWLGAGAVMASLATFISYAGFCLVPLLALYAVLRKSRFGLMVAFLPVVVFGAWLGINYVHYGRFIPGPLVTDYLLVEKVLSPRLVLGKLVYGIVALGGVTVFPLALWFLGTWRRSLAGLFAAVVIASATEVGDYGFWAKGLFVVLFIGGFVGIWEIGSRLVGAVRTSHAGSARDTDEVFLGLWFLGALTFCVLFYITGAARYLLPAVVPFVLMMVRRAVRLVGGTVRRFAVPALLATGSVALALGIADFQFAGIYRDFAGSVRKAYLQPNHTIWFTGEWGFRTYLERLGGRELGRRDTRPREEDLLMIPRLASPYSTLFSSVLDLDSIVLVAPCRASFRVPKVRAGDVLTFTTGMPLYKLSDGLDFSILFVSQEGSQLLRRVRVRPEVGKQWRIWTVSLKPCTGRQGSVVFSVGEATSNDVSGDWLALTRARIGRGGDLTDGTKYDLRDQLSKARVEREPGLDYHTPGNRPVFPYRVWLRQEPTKVPVDRRDYSPASAVRLLDADSHAGFWSMAWGMLPYSLSRGKSSLESIAIYRISREVDGYGETNPTWP